MDFLFIFQATGEIKWRTNLQKPVFASPYVNDGSLLVGCVDSRLYCVDTASGVIVSSGFSLASVKTQLKPNVMCYY